MYVRPSVLISRNLNELPTLDSRVGSGLGGNFNNFLTKFTVGETGASCDTGNLLQSKYFAH